MQIDISARFSFTLPQQTDLLLQFEAAAVPEQAVLNARTLFSPDADHVRVPAQDMIGERIWLTAQGPVEIAYSATVNIQRDLADIATLTQMAAHDLPGETVQYLLPSAYCPSGRFESFTQAEFGEITGGAKIDAIREWIFSQFTYEPGSSTSETTALDSFVERRGVCRDYAHVLITLARASTIPARYASVYAPGVNPPDFHAVAEVFLANPNGPGGSWHLVDPTGMATAAEMVKIGVGRDAADVSFLTSFGQCDFGQSEVRVTHGKS